jgi:hypothetical protein
MNDERSDEPRDEPRDRSRGERQPEGELDGGAYIGNRPELASETIPGGVDDDDERVSAVDTQSSGEGRQEDRSQGRNDEWPGGHRDA